MKKFFSHIATDRNMLKLGMGVTLLLFVMFYNRAGRFKEKTLSGPMKVQVEHLENGNDFITTEEMREKVLKKFQSEFSGVPLDRINLLQLESELQSLDFIKSTDVYLDANNCLNIYVRQREPILRLISPQGRSQYVDKDGSLMPPSIHYSPRVLVAFAAIDLQRDSLNIHSPGLEKDLFELAKYIEGDRFLNALVEEVLVNEQMDWSLIPKFGPSTILLGSLEHLEDKTNRLKRVYKEILPIQGWDYYNLVNLKFYGQVICTKRA